MAVMIVGADHLGNISKNLRQYGVKSIEHLPGRNVGDRKKVRIPLAVSLVILLTDYVNHGTARNVKEQAKAQGVPLLFAKRSWCSLEQQLRKSGQIPLACGTE